ncbi:hypothetical protein A2526_02085 [candidate division WOR-1 bacterium RIFOXYD2_FULL_36_8]|uniref:DUF3467 domain-containing protein n=1 Tax=candidate division WOR-1 bacterium RIFOXYB2_FULL_36_35 TaxID=1802578 RepID=A0A1F4S004_UNCSA|nr:MAG: hypothetical protein A2230_00185 [candidate division WOR-1 bacterium RIFOXYA2_FULL_36_21]OGC13750.1 MAG: hypothetical protein A2290_07745 [candidate division WOR-1 bacterium RIFOXYB2_FULL_36_35]OGC14473.1 MAG: hypothetical protein A2282_08745 [candidate division WOR-1 bacterium RIFOXYA12_FULL_36_13]OGC41327.1 MAG: hypothetical protein A2526_02085 [candidate division WOR-1 bacterium RIFOXYD2_FULL_36_8]
MSEQEVKVEIDDEIAKGIYSNLAILSHNENEFILDFVFVHPPKGKVNSRIITSPTHAKKFLKALQQNIEMYEKKFGQIKEAPEPKNLGGVGFSQN